MLKLLNKSNTIGAFRNLSVQPPVYSTKCESACNNDPSQRVLHTPWVLTEGGVSKGDAERGNDS